jgi:hypothetical protein
VEHGTSKNRTKSGKCEQSDREKIVADRLKEINEENGERSGEKKK